MLIACKIQPLFRVSPTYHKVIIEDIKFAGNCCDLSTMSVQYDSMD